MPALALFGKMVHFLNRVEIKQALNWLEKGTGIDLDGDRHIGEAEMKRAETLKHISGRGYGFLSFTKQLHKMLNRLEKVSGIDLDRDGDVGQEGKVGKQKRPRSALGEGLKRTLLSADWGRAVYLHWSERFVFGWTTWLAFATLILTTRCMQAIYCVRPGEEGPWRLSDAREFECFQGFVSDALVVSPAMMWLVHTTGLVGFVGIVALFPVWIWRNCRRIVRNDLWEDERTAAMFGNFYTEYKPRLWWFFIPVHMTGDVALSFLGVALATVPTLSTVVTLAILGLYTVVIVIVRPHDAWLDFVVDLATQVISILAIVLAEVVRAADGEVSDFMLHALWANLVAMCIFTVVCLWPLVSLFEDNAKIVAARLGLCKETPEHKLAERVLKLQSTARAVQMIQAAEGSLPRKLVISRNAKDKANWDVMMKVQTVRRNLLMLVARRRRLANEAEVSTFRASGSDSDADVLDMPQMPTPPLNVCTSDRAQRTHQSGPSFDPS